MNPLEDIVVAAKFDLPPIPLAWGALPDSIRPLDPTSALGTTGQFSKFDALNQNSIVTNVLANFGHEYVWHCHLLGHEENDMMRALVVRP